MSQPNQEKFANIKEIVCDILELEEDEVSTASLFKEDHSADSLRAIEILATLEKEYKIFNETFEERMELFLDFLNNCKENLQRDRNILIVSHSSVLQKIIFKMYNEDVSLKMGEFLIKKIKVQKKTRKMSLKKSFLI